MTEPYTSPEELERVYDLIELVLPDGWEIDQRSECIQVNWPTEHSRDVILRTNILNKIIYEISDGQHEYILRDYEKLQALIEKRVEETKSS